MKLGEIVYNKDGSITINGYNGDRDNFEFIELSEYYNILKKVEDLISSMHSRHSNIQEDFNTLRQQLRKLT